MLFSRCQLLVVSTMVVGVVVGFTHSAAAKTVPDVCATGSPPTKLSALGDPRARAAAQRGLDHLAAAAAQWQKQHACYGCHVQAVTLEAMTVGLAHQYQVKDLQLAPILAGMLDINGGQRGPNGFSVGGDADHLIETATAFGGSALAHYDERIPTTKGHPSLQRELVQTAEKLISFQNNDGSVRFSDERHPVAAGAMQSTMQALITWRQAQARTADTRYFVPIRKAEAWLTLQGKRISDERPENLQDVAHAIIGLSAAGAGASDKLVQSLARVLDKAQHKDGGWSFFAPEASLPYMTGQALYALRLAGRSDSDDSIRRGSRWLLDGQKEDGGWGGAGFAKAETMWAVLGLVSLDLLSIDVKGLADGQRVEGNLPVTASAVDNGGGKVRRLDVYVDDVVVDTICGANATVTIPADTFTMPRRRECMDDSHPESCEWETGPHMIDFVAENDSGKKARRRFVVYAGDTWIVDIGTRFIDENTEVTFRSLAPASMKARVRLRIFEAKTDKGTTTKGREVAILEQAAVEGPMSLRWNGTTGDKRVPDRRFFAEVSVVDPTGKVRDTEEAIFTHDTLEAQHSRYGDVRGKLSDDGGADLANTEVELVDERGNVVQRSVSTRSGQYRFQNVDGGKYKVRVKKKGFRPWEADVDATPKAEAAAPAASLARE